MEKIASSLVNHVEDFLLTKKLSGCTDKSLEEYRRCLERFTRESPMTDPLAMRAFFVRLQATGLRATSQHKAFGVLKTFFRWCIEIGALAQDPRNQDDGIFSPALLVSVRDAASGKIST